MPSSRRSSECPVTSAILQKSSIHMLESNKPTVRVDIASTTKAQAKRSRRPIGQYVIRKRAKICQTIKHRKELSVPPESNSWKWYPSQRISHWRGRYEEIRSSCSGHRGTGCAGNGGGMGLRLQS